MPKSGTSPSAVIVSGGKQYRVAPGDRILVDRMTDEPGSSVKLGRVLLFTDGSDVKVGSPAVDGLDVEARVIAHRRGPRIESFRYKSKKRVRVHRGGRADLTALEIIAVGGVGVEKDEKEDAEETPKTRGRAKAQPGKKVEATKAGKTEAKAGKTEAKAGKTEAKAGKPETEVDVAEAEAPKRRVRAKKESK